MRATATAPATGGKKRKEEDLSSTIKSAAVEKLTDSEEDPSSVHIYGTGRQEVADIIKQPYEAPG